MNCYIVHLNGPVFKALHSIQGLFDNIFILDNSLKLKHPAVLNIPIELSLTQAYNWIQALETNSFYAIMHDDAEVSDKEVIKAWIQSTLASQENWFQSVTNCQALAIYNRKAIEHIGPLDQMFFNYYMDFDYFVRAKHLGYGQILNPEAERVVSHGCSSTQKRDPLKMLQMQEHTHPFARKYFEAKWRSIDDPYPLPFNGRLL